MSSDDSAVLHLSWFQTATRRAKLRYVNYETVASEFIRALRGHRSQPAFSRRLGYRSNVVYTWESGRGYPTAAVALQATRRVGVELCPAFENFYRARPAWLEQHDPATPQGVAAFLNDLRGRTSIVDLASYSQRSRFAVARWMKGDTEPKLPEFLQMIECCSLRLIDWLEQFVDPLQLPSVAERYRAMETARRVAYDSPWTQAILRALEMREYQEAPRRAGWLAAQVGVPESIERHCLELLEQTGQVCWNGERWQLREVLALDTRKDPEAALRLKAWWGEVGLERVRQGVPGMVYNLFGVSSADLERLRALQKAYFNEVRTIVAQSQPVEHVALTAVLLVDLAQGATPFPAGADDVSRASPSRAHVRSARASPTPSTGPVGAPSALRATSTCPATDASSRSASALARGSAQRSPDQVVDSAWASAGRRQGAGRTTQS